MEQKDRKVFFDPFVPSYEIHFMIAQIISTQSLLFLSEKVIFFAKDLGFKSKPFS